MLESREFCVVSSPSLQDTEQDSKSPDCWCFLPLTRPSLQDALPAYGHPVCAATHDYVHNSQGVVRGSYASSQDSHPASVVGSLSGWLYSLDRWPPCDVANVVFYLADTLADHNSLGLLHGDLGERVFYNRHIVFFIHGFPP